MAIDFNRFSDKARAAVQHAFRLAAQGHYEHITPELMMLSLITRSHISGNSVKISILIV